MVLLWVTIHQETKTVLRLLRASHELLNTGFKVKVCEVHGLERLKNLQDFSFFIHLVVLCARLYWTWE